MKSTPFWRSALVILVIGMAAVPQVALSENPFGKEPFELFKKLDTNGDNRLSEKEFIGERGGAARVKARKQFRRLDVDADKWLSLKELKKS